MSRSPLPSVRDGARTVWLERLEVFGTHAGFLEGPITAEQERERLAELVERFRQGELEPQVIREATGASEAEHGRLPPVVVVLEVTSSEPARDEEADFCSMTVIWLRDDAELTPRQALEAVVGRLDWARHGADWRV